MRLVTAALAAAAITAAANAAPLFGVAAFDEFETQKLYSIDSATGAATLVGDTGVRAINGIAWNPIDGRLYAYTNSSDLYTLNIFTGAGSLVADAFGVIPEGDIAFDSAGVLYAVNGGQIGTVNLATAAFTASAALSSPAGDASGLAWDGKGLLAYLKNGSGADQVSVVSAMTGVLDPQISFNPISSGPFGGLAYDLANDAAFLTDGDNLYSYTLGAVTPVGSHGASGFSGLAFIPAPGAAAPLMALGLFAARRRRA